jgi:Flp pilus assembly CpaF family ATPase
MSFELILPFLRPIEPLLLDDSVSEIMGNPDSSWWYERDGIMRREETVSFDAGRLRTGLEVIANQLGKRLDEDNPSSTPSSLTRAGLRRSFLRSCGLHPRSSFGSSPAVITPSMI